MWKGKEIDYAFALPLQTVYINAFSRVHADADYSGEGYSGTGSLWFVKSQFSGFQAVKGEFFLWKGKKHRTKFYLNTPE